MKQSNLECVKEGREGGEGKAMPAEDQVEGMYSSVRKSHAESEIRH